MCVSEVNHPYRKPYRPSSGLIVGHFISSTCQSSSAPFCLVSLLPLIPPKVPPLSLHYQPTPMLFYLQTHTHTYTHTHTGLGRHTQAPMHKLFSLLKIAFQRDEGSLWLKNVTTKHSRMCFSHQDLLSVLELWHLQARRPPFPDHTVSANPMLNPHPLPCSHRYMV